MDRDASSETSGFRPRSAHRHWTSISTRWHENDVYGHVNNVICYGWFDMAVNGWLVGQGLLNVGNGDPIGLVETSCSYAKPIAFPQNVEVGLALARLGRSSVSHHIVVFVEREIEAAAQGHFTHVYVGRESRRPAPLPDHWRAVLETLA